MRLWWAVNLVTLAWVGDEVMRPYLRHLGVG
jgi:hypothetical protein